MTKKVDLPRPRDLDICYEPRFTDIVHELRAKIAEVRTGMSSTLEKLSPWLFTIGLFVLWELACRIFKIDNFILPAPSQTFVAMAQYWRRCCAIRSSRCGPRWRASRSRSAFGIVLGLIVGWSRTIYRGLYPVMIGFNSIPKVAVVPILIIWFGIGEIPAILTAFPDLVLPDRRERGDRARHHGAGARGRAAGARCPQARHHAQGRDPAHPALPVRLAQGRDHARLRRRGGVGDHRRQCRARLPMVQAGSNFQMPLVFAGLLGLAVEGIAMYAVFAYVEVYFTRWAFRSSMSAAA